jgi:hypothetical protein
MCYVNNDKQQGVSLVNYQNSIFYLTQYKQKSGKKLNFTKLFITQITPTDKIYPIPKTVSIFTSSDKNIFITVHCYINRIYLIPINHANLYCTPKPPRG